MKESVMKKIWNNGKARVYFLAFTIGFPLLMLASFWYFYYEKHQEFLWVYSENYQMTTYRYTGNREDLPPDLAKIISAYPNGKIINISVNKAKDKDFSGMIYFLTSDDFSKVKEFYKKEFGNIENETESDFEATKDGQKMKISQTINNEWSENKIGIQFFENEKRL